MFLPECTAGAARATYQSIADPQLRKIGVEIAPELVEPQIVWDRELYAYASRLLHAVIAGIDCFDDDLAALRRRNAFYYPIGRTLDRVWEPVRDVKEARLLNRSARGAAP